MTPLDLLWLFFILSSLQPMLSQRYLAMQRARALHALEKRNGSRAVTLIHRREGFAFLGIPFGGFIDIDDSEALIRVVESTGDDKPIDLVLHTPGGLVLAAEQIAAALAAHPAEVTVYVPHYAMSGGTLIALASDRIVMSPSAVLGPVDPQLGEYPVASVLEAVGRKDVNELDDRTLILADVGRKARRQVEEFVEKLLDRHMTPDDAREIARALSEGRWTHDFPIDVERAQKLGLPVSTDLPDEVRSLMGLYPQPRGRRPSVEYIPAPAPSRDGESQRRWVPSPRAPARPAGR
ncbi:MAG: ATP-dependent Clp protease proteolytic subunit [Actinomycetota bacterium]|jgi:ClpP class serine protease|nr:ATP-dependent Clp protease proteolytic subunit [Actinomycetota bacterium]